MDWDAAIETNREALKRVLVGLLAMAGVAGVLPATLPRRLHRAVLRLLRPAESAARRLVIVAARQIAVAAPLVPTRGTKPKQQARSTPRPGFCLFDPPSRWGRPRRPAPASTPRISVPGFTAPAPVRLPPAPFDPLDTTRLGQRLAALAAALDDLPRHARRFARWQARRRALRAAQDEAAPAADAGHRPRRFSRVLALRPGRPPGHPPARSRHSGHEVHDILAVSHDLALWALEPADTS